MTSTAREIERRLRQRRGGGEGEGGGGARDQRSAERH